MSKYIVLSESSIWSASKLRLKVENIINSKATEGYELVSVTFGFNNWMTPTVYITMKK
jgi:hypothetical protein